MKFSEYIDSLAELFDQLYEGYPTTDPDDPIIHRNEDDE